MPTPACPLSTPSATIVSMFLFRGHRMCQPTNAFVVPWRACLWFRRNLGSVPFREGYLEVLGFLILGSQCQLGGLRRSRVTYPLRCAFLDCREISFPTERLLRAGHTYLIMLRRVLGLWSKGKRWNVELKNNFAEIWRAGSHARDDLRMMSSQNTVATH